ncbi:BAALC protein, partial [Dyaphorophyia castanea]|nr:BAALC protein [Platysteira castanea]
MGCGGSRADAIEPRYYESWTRETESTWLTNTDSESPPQEGGSAEGPGREQGGPRPGPLEDGKLAHTGVSTASATAGMLNAEKKNSCGSQCANPMVHGMGATTQRQNGFRNTESKWDTQKMPIQEVAINVTKGIRQSDRRKTKNYAN